MKKYFYLIFFLSLFPISVKAIDLNTIVDTAINQFSNTNPQSTKEIAQLNQTEIPEMVKAVTVKVTANNNRGTGTIIGKEGNKYLIITNFHVIRGSNNITIETADGNTHQAQLIENGISNKYDLALLEFTSENQYQKVEISPLLPKSLDLKIPIIAGGYADDTRQLKVTRGEIKQIADKPLQDGYEIGYSGEIVQGMSGGGIFVLYEDPDIPEDSKLYLIGINGRSSYPIINTGYVYQDGSQPSTAEIAKMREVNWGIAINTLLIYIKSEILTVYKLPLPEVAPDIQTTTTGYIAVLEAKAKQFTVRIDSSSKYNGSGVIIAKEGKTYTVLTADHVLCEKSKNATDKDPCLDYNYTITTHDGKTREINKSTIIREEGVDLAVFKFESEESYAVAEIADYNPNRNDFVFTAGFPKIGKNEPQWLFSGGRINDKEGGLLQTRQSDLSNQQSGLSQSVASLTGGYELVYTSITFGGMSGGAVLDSQGRVIGIHGRSEGGEVGRIQLGYSLGIPIGTFIGLQERLKAKPQLLTTAKPEISRQQQGEIIEAINNVIVPNTRATADIWIERGGQLWRLRRYSEAIKAFEEAIKQNNPDNVYLAWYGKGLALFDLGKYQTSIKAFEQAIINLPKEQNLKEFHSHILQRQSEIYSLSDYLSPPDPSFRNDYQIPNYEKALTLINQAITFVPSNPNLYNQKFLILRTLKRYDESLEAISQAIKIAIRSAWYINRGIAYSELNQYENAISDFNQAIGINPQSLKAYKNRGITYSKLKQYQKALVDFNKAINIDPEDTQIYKIRAYVYVTLQEYEKAIADYSKIISIPPLPRENRAFDYYRRASLYYLIKKYEQTITDCSKALEIYPILAPEIYTLRGLAYYDSQQYEKAISDYNYIIREFAEYDANNSNAKNFADYYYIRGHSYYYLKQYKNALKDIDKALNYYSQQGNEAGYENAQKLIILINSPRNE